MTRDANARFAGAAFLLYILTGISSLAIESPITGASDITARLATIAAEPWRIKVALLLGCTMFVYALTLGVTLHALTRDRHPDLALGGLVFRSAEGVTGLVGALTTVGLFWLATSSAASSLDPTSVRAIGAVLARLERTIPTIAAFAFSIGSLCFTATFVLARSIPLWLAWLGVVASALLVVVLPVQLAFGVGSLVANLVWLPMLVFELILAVRLLMKGGAAVLAAT